MTMANAHKPREQRYEEPARVAEAPTTSLNVLAAADTPLLFRFNAFADLHLDTYENPAYGAGFKSSETRATTTV